MGGQACDAGHGILDALVVCLRLLTRDLEDNLVEGHVAGAILLVHHRDHIEAVGLHVEAPHGFGPNAAVVVGTVTVVALGAAGIIGAGAAIVVAVASLLFILVHVHAHEGLVILAGLPGVNVAPKLAATSSREQSCALGACGLVPRDVLVAADKAVLLVVLAVDVHAVLPAAVGAVLVALHLPRVPPACLHAHFVAAREDEVVIACQDKILPVEARVVLVELEVGTRVVAAARCTTGFRADFRFRSPVAVAPAEALAVLRPLVAAIVVAAGADAPIVAHLGQRRREVQRQGTQHHQWNYGSRHSCKVCLPAEEALQRMW
mmetsp:Transcript_34279/g.97153  ORF Transcript_34279/g.97153 Transcript_34279/m.97153 type:complete len:319 (+) Transcript_34279:713-1669(+)